MLCLSWDLSQFGTQSLSPEFSYLSPEPSCLSSELRQVQHRYGFCNHLFSRYIVLIWSFVIVYFKNKTIQFLYNTYCIQVKLDKTKVGGRANLFGLSRFSLYQISH